MLRTLILLSLSLLATLAPRAAAQDDATLAVGSAAPPLVIEQWPRGVPVTRFERGRVYVIEFWATWCTPCHLVVPKLTELQRNNPALTVISVAASEQATTVNRDDRLEKVQDYVSRRSDEIGFTIAYDGSGEMWRRWMVASQRGGIPAAFIVGPDGRLTWIGNPLVPDFEKELAATLARPDVNKAPAPTRFTGVVPPRGTQLPPRTWAAAATSAPLPALLTPAPNRESLPRASAQPRASQTRAIRIEFVPESSDELGPQRSNVAPRLASPPPVPTKSATKPVAKPVSTIATTRPQSAKAAVKPAKKSVAAPKPATKPATRSAIKPATKPSPKPNKKPVNAR